MNTIENIIYYKPDKFLLNHISKNYLLHEGKLLKKIKNILNYDFSPETSTINLINHLYKNNLPNQNYLKAYYDLSSKLSTSSPNDGPATVTATDETDAKNAALALEEAGFGYQNHTELFAWLRSNTKYANGKVAEAFIVLLKGNISFSDNIDLYTKVAHEITFGNNKPYSTLLFLTEKGLNFPECYSVKTLIEHSELMMQVLNKLLAATFSPSVHQNVFRKVIAQLNLEKVDPLTILHLVDKLCRFAAVHAIDDLAAIDTIIETHAALHETLKLGPLNKNESTRRIEQLLEKLSDEKIFNHSRWFYKDESYYVVLENDTTYNLSLLIKNANLSHLALSDSLISKLAVLLRQCVVRKAWNETSNNPVVKLLPPAQQAAINIYITDCYKNINLLFRGEELEPDAVTNTQSQLIPANFLLGCLLNDAVNKLNNLVDKKKPWTYAQEDWIELYAAKLEEDEDTLSPLERKMVAQQEWLKLYAATVHNSPLEKKTVSQEDWVKVYAPTLHHGTLARKEALTPEDMKRRHANPWTFPAVTSTSHLKDGTGWISRSKTAFNRIEGRGYSINPSEGEILFSQGTQVVTKNYKQMNLFPKLFVALRLNPLTAIGRISRFNLPG